jgi:hypothetical protein
MLQELSQRIINEQYVNAAQYVEVEVKQVCLQQLTERSRNCSIPFAIPFSPILSWNFLERIPNYDHMISCNII